MATLPKDDLRGKPNMFSAAALPPSNLDAT